MFGLIDTSLLHNIETLVDIKNLRIYVVFHKKRIIFSRNFGYLYYHLPMLNAVGGLKKITMRTMPLLREKY